MMNTNSSTMVQERSDTNSSKSSQVSQIIASPSSPKKTDNFQSLRPKQLPHPLRGGLKLEDLEQQWRRDEERYHLKMISVRKKIQAKTKVIEDLKKQGITGKLLMEKEKQLGADLQEFDKIRGKLDGIRERLGESKTEPIKVPMRVLSPRQIEMKQRTEDILKLRCMSPMDISRKSTS